MIPISQLITTYFPDGQQGIVRSNTFLKTLNSWKYNLKYDGDIYLHIADDGTKHFMDLYEQVMCNDWDVYTDWSRQDRCGVGASLNTGLQKSFETSPVVLYAVDDWSLIHEFNITPWVKLLLEREDVGMVRLGPPHPYLTGRIECFTEDWQGWGLRLDKQQYSFAQRPFLMHKRFYDHYGPFKENCSAMHCEADYSFKTCAAGPDIVLALPHPWMHEYGVDLSEVDPKKE